MTMNKLVMLLLLIPFIAISQIKPKPKSSAATKPKAAIKLTKPNAQVEKLVDSAYVLYQNSKDKECEALLKKILVLSPKNKDVFMIRANISLYNSKFYDVWKNLNIAYKNNPKEPEVYSQFAMRHLNYEQLSDSFKRVLCRKTIKLSNEKAEGYVSLAMVAATSGSYDEALRYFDLSLSKIWIDEESKTASLQPYAQCQNETGDKLGAIETLDKLIPKLYGTNNYNATFMRATYKLDLNNTDIKNDLDTLNIVAPEQLGVMGLNAKYLKKMGNSDSACNLARKIKSIEGGESIDLAQYCNDLTTTLKITEGKNLTYEIGDLNFIVQPTKFDYENEIVLNWYRGYESNWDTGKVTIVKYGLDSSVNQQINFKNGIKELFSDRISIWLSKKQYLELNKDSVTNILTSSEAVNTKFYFDGHEQFEILNTKNIPQLIDCIRVTNGNERLWYLNDPKNPLIIKMELEQFTIILSKSE